MNWRKPGPKAGLYPKRRRREILRGNLDRLPAPAPEPEDDAALLQRRECLYEAVRDAIANTLTEKQREAVERYFFEGKSQGEIARELGVSQQVVQRRLFGAIRNGRTGKKIIGGALPRLREVLAPLVLGGPF